MRKQKHEVHTNGRLAKGGGGAAKGGGGAAKGGGGAAKGGGGAAKGGGGAAQDAKKCVCDKDFEGDACEVDLLAKGKKSPLDPTYEFPKDHSQPPCVGRIEDFALDDPCADPRRTRIPMAPADPPDPGTKDEWPAWAKDTEGEEGWRQFKGNEAWSRKKGGGEQQAAMQRRRRR